MTDGVLVAFNLVAFGADGVADAPMDDGSDSTPRERAPYDQKPDKFLHHARWTLETNAIGQVSAKTPSALRDVGAPEIPATNENLAYIQLETGLYYDEDGRQIQAKEELQVMDGFILGRRAGHKVVFRSNLNSLSAVDLTTVDGKRLQSHVLGLSYFDTESGKSVLIAEAKDTEAVFYPPNQVVYPDVFADVKADVRYTYTKAGLEQDVIFFNGELPAPEDFDLNPATTRVEVWSEFFVPPVPEKKAKIIKREADESRRQKMAEPDVIDESLSFGSMRIGTGNAFEHKRVADRLNPLVDNNGKGSRVRVFSKGSVAVAKRWHTVGDRHFLIESVDYPAARAVLEPVAEPAKTPSSRSVQRASLERVLPRARTLASAAHPGRILVAQDSYQPKGLVLDYYLASTTENVTLEKGVTYHIVGAAHLSGKTRILEGAVVKFAAGASLTVSGTLEMPKGTAYLTSELDDSVGVHVLPAGATHSFAMPALGLDGVDNGTVIENLEFRYAEQGIAVLSPRGDYSVRHCTFYKCRTPIEANSANVTSTDIQILAPPSDAAATAPTEGGSVALQGRRPRPRVGLAELPDYGNSIGAAYSVSANSSVSGDIGYAGDEDYFRVDVLWPGTLTAYSTGSTDTYGHLLNSSGSELTSSDDNPYPNFSFSYSVSAGTYYIRVHHYSSTGTGAYTLNVSTTSSDDYGNSAGSAASISLGGSLSGSINYSGDEDWFAVSVPGTGTLRAYTTGSTDTYGYILNPSQTVLASDDDAGVDNNFDTSASVFSGTHYIRVRHYSGGTGPYTLYVTYTCQTPATPTGLGAVAGTRQITLNWSAATYAYGYTVKRSSTGAAGSYSTISYPTATSYVDTGLADGTTYYYVVSASNSCGTSGDSSSASATTGPAAPTGFGGIGGVASVNLFWSAPTGAYAYQVKRATVSGGPYSTLSPVFMTSFTDSPLADGTTYYYRVFAQSVSGAPGSDSSEISVITIPAAPTGVAVSTTAGPGKLVVSWNAATGSSSYLLKRSTTGGVPYTTISTGLTGTSYTDTGLSGAINYCYVVSAANVSGYSANSIQACGTPPNNPPTITGISNQTIDQDTSTGPLSFTVGDIETATSSLGVSGGSSNATLVPVGNIVFGGSGASRTVNVTPVVGQYGTSTITVSVSDGSASVGTSFTLTVREKLPTPNLSVSFNSDHSTATVSASAQLGTVYYTTDGSTPTTSSTTTPPSFSVSTCVNARAIQSGYTSSAVATICVGVTAAVSFSPSGHDPITYSVGPLNLQMTAESGATVNYKAGTTGSWLSTSSGSTPAIDGIDSGSGTVQAYAYTATKLRSTTSTNESANPYKLRLANPTSTASYSGSGYASGSLTFSAQSGATIRYTTDGTLPTPSSSQYSTALTYSTPTKVYARAYKTGYIPSGYASSWANKLPAPKIANSTGLVTTDMTANNSTDIWLLPNFGYANMYAEEKNTAGWSGTLSYSTDVPNANYPGSFLAATATSTVLAGNTPPINISQGRTYSQAGWFRNINASPQSRDYAGIINYDKDSSFISADDINESSIGYTYLTQPLANGSTTAYLGNEAVFSPVNATWYYNLFVPLLNFSSTSEILGGNQPSAIVSLMQFVNLTQSVWPQVTAVSSATKSVTLSPAYSGATLPAGLQSGDGMRVVPTNTLC